MLAFSQNGKPDDLIGQALRGQRRDAMEKALADVEDAFQTLGRDPWSDDEKVSEQALPAIFNIDPEVTTVLDQLLEVMQLAKPAR